MMKKIAFPGRFFQQDFLSNTSHFCSDCKKYLMILICTAILSTISWKQAFAQKGNKTIANNEYTVAAYVWPSCHDDKMAREALWGEGTGEWEVIKKGNQRFEGHYQPRIPLWGYKLDNDPLAWETKIEAATDHGVNTFIFDWYWYDGKPFLEGTVNDGFLKAKNNSNMKFYIMWANHDAKGSTWNPHRYKNDTVLWKGTVDWENFQIVVARVIKQYFMQPNYFKLDGKPVFSIYNLDNLVKSFNGFEGTKKALDYFRQEVKKAGFPDLYLQGVGNGSDKNVRLMSDKVREGKSINEIVSDLKLNSITMYNWNSPGILEDYIKYGEGALKIRSKWDSILTVPFVPVVSVGWDSSPRFPKQGKESVINKNSTPQSFAAYLQKTREYVRNHPKQPKIIIINAWNEWVEGSYLEPDMRWGYQYLQAVKDIMSGKYDKYK
jgi:hypothetical protein